MPNPAPARFAYAVPVTDIEELRLRLAEIDATSGDVEGAHKAENQLHWDVLAGIAGGVPNAQEMALEALRTLEIVKARWYS